MIKRIYPLIMIFLLGITSFSCQTSVRGMLEAGVSKDLAKYRKKFISDVQYDLLFHIPENQELPLRGEITIDFTQTRAQHGVVLDFRGGSENLHDLLVNGQQVSYEYRNEHIIIPSRYVVPGRNKVKIAFTATDQALNRSEEFMYTLFVPDRAATAFPCFDQPDLKATFALTLDIPQQWTALSNGPQLSQTVNLDRKVVVFEAQKPISTYLFAFTAGKYKSLSQSQNGRTITLFHRETDESKLEHNIPEIFSQHFQALEWLADYTGIEYPFTKFDLVIIPGFQYSGMEHPGAVWYRDTRLLLDVQASMSQQLQKANLIAHETAHMWFGDLVTMQWFDDVWLKEVFAGFMADKMVQPMFPDQNHELQFLLTHFPRAYGVDRSRGTHPIRQNLTNLNQAGNLYGSIIYNKAPIVFQQLERIMGEEPFREAVREYLQVYSYGNADWDQLVHYFDKYSKENISQWSQAWIYGRGIPEINYQIQKGQGPPDLLLKSTSFPKGNPYPAQWIELAIMDGEALHQQSVFIGGADVKHQLEGKVVESSLLLPNGFGWGYGYFALRDIDRQYLLQNIQNIDYVNVRAAAHLMLYEDFLNANIAPEDYLNTLFINLGSETDPLMLPYLLERIQNLFWNFMDEKQRLQAAAPIGVLLWERMLAAPSDLKSTFLKSFFNTALLSPEYEKMILLFNKAISFEDYTLSEDDRFALVSALCIRNHEQGMQLLDRLKKETQNPDRVRRMEFLKEVLSPETDQRIAFFERLKDPSNRRPEPWALEGLGFFHHPLRAEHSLPYLSQTLQMTREIQQTGDIFFPLRWLEASLSGYRDEEALQITEDYLTGNPDLQENLHLKVLQASDMLERSVRINNKFKP